MSLPGYSVGQKLEVLEKMFFQSSSGCGAPMMFTTPMSPEPPRAFIWTTNKLPEIYTANHATFTIMVHSYGRFWKKGDIVYMQALYINNKYIVLQFSYSITPFSEYKIFLPSPPPDYASRSKLHLW